MSVKIFLGFVDRNGEGGSSAFNVFVLRFIDYTKSFRGPNRLNSQSLSTLLFHDAVPIKEPELGRFKKCLGFSMANKAVP